VPWKAVGNAKWTVGQKDLKCGVNSASTRGKENFSSHKINKGEGLNLWSLEKQLVMLIERLGQRTWSLGWTLPRREVKKNFQCERYGCIMLWIAGPWGSSESWWKCP
jgi:hypothetical protein